MSDDVTEEAMPVEQTQLTQAEIDEQAKEEMKYKNEMQKAIFNVMTPYQSFSVVNACEVVLFQEYGETDENEGAFVLCKSIDGKREQKFYVGDEMTERYKPVPGDFMVIHNENYSSFIPRDGFLQSYAMLKAVPQGQLEEAAMLAHEMNRAYCASLGDDSQLPWLQCPQWQKESAIEGVKIHAENPAITPEQSHEAWMEHKLADGWVYGDVKDADKKTHPCIVAYSDLPQAQRSKYFIFKAAVSQVIK